jgi:hypothetical protein
MIYQERVSLQPALLKYVVKIHSLFFMHLILSHYARISLATSLALSLYFNGRDILVPRPAEWLRLHLDNDHPAGAILIGHAAAAQLFKAPAANVL